MYTNLICKVTQFPFYNPDHPPPVALLYISKELKPLPSSTPYRNSVIFAAVKRSISTAILFLSFVLAFCNAGYAALERSATADHAVEKAGRYATHYFSHPHTELEIYTGASSIAGNNITRIPSAPGFVTCAEYTITELPQWPTSRKDQPTGLSFKDYLSHIYPSHNFW